MKSSIKSNRPVKTISLLPALLAAAAFAVTSPAIAEQPGKVVPPNATKYGNDHGGWSAAYFQWYMAQPLEGHPGVDSPEFDVTAGQSGDVWFLSGLFGTAERTCTIPAGKALFFPMANVECSSLEAPDSGFYGATAKEQRACAKYWADHIVGVFCEIDGEAVAKPESYRAKSPQYTFTAPSPWIFGDVGGTGTSLGDGYYILLTPLAPGEHTIRFGGTFRFTLEEDGFDAELPFDTTYHLTFE